MGYLPTRKVSGDAVYRVNLTLGRPAARVTCPAQPRWYWLALVRRGGGGRGRGGVGVGG